MVRLLIGMVLVVVMAGCASHPPLQTVDRVDLARYEGTWYEIASLPQWYQRNCTAVEARYFLRADGKVDVLNLCRKHHINGPVKLVLGTARTVSPDNSKLKVRFGLIEGDYWVLRLGDNYEYAAVGTPDREALWILSRQRTISPAVYERLKASLAQDGFDVSRLQLTPQPQ